MNMVIDSFKIRIGKFVVPFIHSKEQGYDGPFYGYYINPKYDENYSIAIEYRVSKKGIINAKFFYDEEVVGSRFPTDYGFTGKGHYSAKFKSRYEMIEAFAKWLDKCSRFNCMLVYNSVKKN